VQLENSGIIYVTDQKARLTAIWRLKNSSGDEEEILQPLKTSLADYAARISDAIKTLEVVEKRSQLDILSELLTKVPNIEIQGMVTKLQIDLFAGRNS
jgi:hypothetical protein